MCLLFLPCGIGYVIGELVVKVLVSFVTALWDSLRRSRGIKSNTNMTLTADAILVEEAYFTQTSVSLTLAVLVLTNVAVLARVEQRDVRLWQPAKDTVNLHSAWSNTFSKYGLLNVWYSSHYLIYIYAGAHLRIL